MNILKKICAILEKKDKKYFILIIIATIVGSLLELLGVSVILPLIYAVMDFNLISTGKMLLLVSGIAAVYIIKAAYLFFSNKYMFRYLNMFKADLSKRMLAHYLEQPYEYFLVNNSSLLIKGVAQDTNYVLYVLTNGFNLFAEACILIFMVAYMLIIDYKITFIVLSVVGVVAFLAMGFSGKKNIYFGKLNQEYNVLSWKTVQQAIGGIKEIKVIGSKAYFVGKYEEVAHNMALVESEKKLYALIPRIFLETAGVFSILLVIVFKMVTASEPPELLIPKLGVFAVVAMKILPSANKIGVYWNEISFGIPSLNLVYKELKNEETNSHILDQIEEKLPFDQQINISNVSFRYENAAEYILNHANCLIPKGTMVAFVGISGAGKSTLADIIMGLLPAESGCLFCDETDIRTNLRGWQKNIGYIPQTIYLSDDTIRNNILFGRSCQESGDEYLLDVLKKSQLFDFVCGLKAGLDTVIGERGVRLSGGQRQRIGIARALYSDPEIMIFDEATSSLDHETEAAILEAIDDLHGKKTLIVIAHRLNTIESSDIRYQIIEGKIVKDS